jgi:nitroreductase
MFAMKKPLLGVPTLGLVILISFLSSDTMAAEIALPSPSHKGTVSVEEALKARRTHRSFQSRPLTLEQFSQILWGAYGVTSQKYGSFLKTAPSAGALYPLDIYGVVGQGGVETLAPGVYHFRPKIYSCKRKPLDSRRELSTHLTIGVWSQPWGYRPVMIRS